MSAVFKKDYQVLFAWANVRKNIKFENYFFSLFFKVINIERLTVCGGGV